MTAALSVAPEPTLDDPPPTVYALWSRVFAAARAVGKNSWNGAGGGFHFRGIDAVLNAAHPIMAEHGVFAVPETRACTVEIVETGQNRTRMRMATVVADYRLYGPAGDSFLIASNMHGEAFDSGDKAVSKAYSVAFRTALIQALALPTEERDPDADTYVISPGNGGGQPAPQNRTNRPANTAAAPELTFEEKVVKAGDHILRARDLAAARERVAWVEKADLRDVPANLAPAARERLNIGADEITLGRLAEVIVERFEDAEQAREADAAHTAAESAHPESETAADENPDPHDDGGPDDPWAGAATAAEQADPHGETDHDEQEAAARQLDRETRRRPHED